MLTDFHKRRARLLNNRGNQLPKGLSRGELWREIDAYDSQGSQVLSLLSKLYSPLIKAGNQGREVHTSGFCSWTPAFLTPQVSQEEDTVA